MAKRGPKKGSIPWNKGKKLPKRGKRSKETKAKIRTGMQNYIASIEGQEEIKERSKKIRRTVQERFDTNPEYSQRISQGMIEHYQTEEGDEHRQRISKANAGSGMKGRKHSEESKAKIRASIKKHWADKANAEANAERIEKMRASIQNKFDDDPEYRERVSQGVKAAYKNDPAYRERVSASNKAYSQTEEGKAAMQRRSEENKTFFQTEEGKARKQEMSEANKAFLQTEAGIEFRKGQAERASAQWKNRPKTRAHKEAISKGMQLAIKEGRYRPGTYSKRGHHQSPKVGRIPYRSSYEEAYYKILDDDPNVATYEAEPNDHHVKYEYDGMSKIYIPDLLIVFTNSEHLIVEIKPSDRAEEPQNRAKHDAAVKEFGSSNFIVITEDEVFESE